jgi:hypothetical protein
VSWPRVQVCRKRLAGKCFFCPCADYESLQCHRIVPGEQGGTYHWDNTLALCANCHARVTAGVIVVYARRFGTGGSYIHCRVGDEEKFIKEYS